MSIDVFGHPLNRRGTAAPQRGPPGIGFNFTPDENFDIGGKRLCNVSDAKEQNDALSLGLGRGIIKNELQSMLNTIKDLQEKVDALETILQAFQDYFDEELKSLRTDLQEEITIHHTQIIAHVESRLRALEKV